MIKDKYNQDENDVEDFEDFEEFYGLDKDSDDLEELDFCEEKCLKVDSLPEGMIEETDL